MKMQNQGILKTAAESFLREKNRLRNVWLQDVADRMKIRRKSIANEAGMSEGYDVGTYPCSDNSMTVTGASTGAVVTAVLATALGAGALGFAANSIMAPAAETVIDTITEIDIYDYTVDSEVVPPPTPQ
jgi:hypothetical protein